MSKDAGQSAETWGGARRSRRRGGGDEGTSYEDKAKAYIEQAEEAVAKVTDPGQKTTVYALPALTHAVLEVDHDV
ncbi:hypothetical protein ACH4NS_36620 [Streptomyces mutabilis]|uniref:hypothetical protein n=1 Tax=Streptomyces mutabilis TaxID=67332 RepID=UPI0037AF6778